MLQCLHSLQSGLQWHMTAAQSGVSLGVSSIEEVFLFGGGIEGNGSKCGTSSFNAHLMQILLVSFWRRSSHLIRHTNDRHATSPLLLLLWALSHQLIRPLNRGIAVPLTRATVGVGPSLRAKQQGNQHDLTVGGDDNFPSSTSARQMSSTPTTS